MIARFAVLYSLERLLVVYLARSASLVPNELHEWVKSWQRQMSRPSQQYVNGYSICHGQIRVSHRELVKHYNGIFAMSHN